MPMFFGYRRAQFGPPTCFKAYEPVYACTKHSGDDPDYPYIQVRTLTPAEEGMSLNELKTRHPYVSHTK